MRGVVVDFEEPTLEQEKRELVKANAEIHRLQHATDERILALISQRADPGKSILDSALLIDQLEQSKSASADQRRRMAQSEQAEVKTDTARLRYYALARHAATLYFAMAEMAKVNHMYQFSLARFMQLFTAVFEETKAKASVVGSGPPAAEQEHFLARLKALARALTAKVHSYVIRSLYEQDRLTWSFLLLTRLLRADAELDEVALGFFLHGADATHQASLPNPAPLWISPEAWRQTSALDLMEPFRTGGLSADISQQPERWRKWVSGPAPHLDPMPPKWEHITPFHRLCLLRCLRPDRLPAAIRNLVASRLDPSFVEPVSVDISTVWREAGPLVPVVLLLSPGEDPTRVLEMGAERQEMGGRFRKISLGLGQSARAEKMLQECMSLGHWLFMQNCHLAPDWLPTLARQLECVAPDRVHQRFRLFLATRPTPHFPVSILENALKVSTEAPSSIRETLTRSMDALIKQPDFQDRVQRYGTNWTRIHYLLAFLHAVVVGRSRYAGVGWSLPYHFSHDELRLSAKQLGWLLTEGPTCSVPLALMFICFCPACLDVHISVPLALMFIFLSRLP
ncbi:putative Dynein heavy chain 1; axonemal [Paratrimastix pyriformis]|uniref:Dynein heavy chain 1 n=1 Tax=Paratrimastix pyriformis TaxID=342808 RepID=A0ABQ8U8N1_9EUKA|nr:putative Dynein heavy chain 1; axonemal [Paratrimastix pyriformis]